MSQYSNEWVVEEMEPRRMALSTQWSSNERPLAARNLQGDPLASIWLGRIGEPGPYHGARS